LHNIIKELKRKGYISREICEKHNFRIDKSDCNNESDYSMSDSTFYRIISDIKETGLKLRYNRAENIYVIDKERKSPRFSIIECFEDLEEDDHLILFYSFIKNIVKSSYFFPPVNKELNNKGTDFETILYNMRSYLQNHQKKLSNYIDYYINDHYKIEQKERFNEIFSIVFESFRKKYQIKFRYLNDSFLTEVRVEPLKLVYYNGKWFLIAYMVRKSKIEVAGSVLTDEEGPRTYNLSNISEIELTSIDFPIFKEEEILIEYRNSFGFYTDKDLKKATIRFYKDAIRYIKETIWHSSQNITHFKDRDYVEMNIKYPEQGKHELISKVLSHGKDAEIITPTELRELWLQKIKSMFNEYLNS